jgi:adenylate cyclase
VTAQAHTFLFMDLVGFTALTFERGDDGAADVAQRFYAHVRSVLSEHAAEEIKTIGDGMMVRCQDPNLAVRLGVRIVDEMDAGGLPPLRVGVHTGSAVRRDGDWYGAAVNVSARLCSAAGGGEVLVSDATCEAAGSLSQIEFGERQLHWLKNVAEPVTARPAYEREPAEARQPLAAMLSRACSRRGTRSSMPLKQSEVLG